MFQRLPKTRGGLRKTKAKRQQTNLSNNWFISLSPLASIFLEDEHYGRIHCKFHFFQLCTEALSDGVQ
jgi:hypothetical protein